MRKPNETGPDMSVGVALILVAVAVLLATLAFRAATAPPPEHLAGWMVGPCDARPTSTVEVQADGEVVGTGAVGAYNDVGRLCRATVSVNDLDPHEWYTVTSGELSGTVARRALHDMVTIRLYGRK